MSANATASVAAASITPSASIFALTRGTAPNRQFVIQWTQTKRFSGADSDDFSFQIILEEAPPQQMKVVYGTVSTNVNTDLLLQVGLRGNDSADFNARTSSTSWSATNAATANTNRVAFKKTNVPPNGLTFVWTPICPAMANPGALSGAINVCPGTTQNYSLPAVTGASYYTWSYSGTGVTLSATTATPVNTISFASNATPGTLTVRPANACVGAGVSVSSNITLISVTPATIAYPSGASYCTSNAPVSVNRTGPNGGAYSVSPVGLSVNSSTGQITPSSSTSGAYTVTYTYTNNGCASLTATTAVTIKPLVNIETTASPAVICSAGNAQLTTQADAGSNYSVSPVAYNLLNPAGAPTVIWNTTTDDAVSSAIPLPFSFNYYGQVINQLTVSSNGFIELGGVSGLSALSAQTIPSISTPNNVVALAWRDLKLDIAANPSAYVRYFTNGITPNRVFVVEYSGISFYNISSGTGNVTGQIRLYESDNHIEIHALVDDGGLNLSKTMGLENASGTSGITPPNRNNTVWNATMPEAWSFFQATYSYTWSPANFLSSTSIPNPVVTGLNTSTNYTVQVTNNLTGCSNSANINLTYANAQLTGSSGASRCGTGVLSLSATAVSGSNIAWYTAATGGTRLAAGPAFTTPSIGATTTYYVAAEATDGASTLSVGDGATTPTSYEGVFYHLFGGAQTQFLIRASELSAAGLQAGNIVRIGLRFLSVSPQSYSGFAISMMHTANTDMSGGLNGGPFTPVYSAATLNLNSGINTYTLSTPFNWDGGSNIIIKICWSNNNTGGTSNYAQTDATSYTSGAYYRADSRSPNAVCSANAATGFLSARPQFYFTGTGLLCSSPRVAVTAIVNPQPTPMVMNPTVATICSSDLPRALGFTGGTYPSGISNLFTQDFETFPAFNFSASGAGISASSNTTYFTQGTKSVLLTYNSGLTTASANNAYRQTSGIDLSPYNSASLRFSHICALEGPTTTYDAGYVQYSTDGGTNWTTFPSTAYAGSASLVTNINGTPVSGTVFSTRSYSDWVSRFTSSTINPGSGPAAALWKTEIVNIPAPALAADFRIRFLVTSDGSVQYYGWLIDDINIVVPASAAVPVVWSPQTGLFTDAGAITPYTGSAMGTVYAKPSADITYTASGVAPGGCTVSGTAALTVKPGNTWLGVNSNWSDIQNWCPGVPTSSIDVTINTGVAFMPVLSSGTGTVRNITVQNGATLTIRNATMQIVGTVTAAGTIIADSGTVELNGSAAQTISGSNFSGRNLRNLIVSNNVNVSSAPNDTLRILGTVSFGNVSNRNFNSGNNITLVSNAGGTARIGDITNNNNNTGNSLSGKFVVERHIPARRAWRLLTAPISANQQTINQAWQENTNGNWTLNPNPGYGTHITGGSTRTTVQGFDQGPFNASIFGHSGTAWNVIPPATNTELVTSRSGYMVFVRGSRAINLPNSSPSTVPDATVLRPTGTVRFGSQAPVTSPVGGMTPMGNPYPSAINFNSLSRSGVIGGVGGNAYYLWDPNLGGSSGAGAFVTFSWNGSAYDKNIVTGGGSSLITNTGVIPSGAAFIVNFNAGGSIAVAEKDKIADVGNTPYVFRPSGDVGKLRLTLYGLSQPAEPALLDGNLITFTEPGNNALDDEDARKAGNFYENIASFTGNSRLSIERRKEIATEGDTLFYHLWNLRPKNYRIEVAPETITLPPGLQAFFEDTYLNQRRELNLVDTAQIDFAVTSDAASAATARFRIVFVPAAVLPVHGLSLQATCSNGKALLTWQTGIESNIRGYTLQASADGIGFNTVSFFPTLGSNARYRWMADNPTDAATNFYRVKGNGLDGSEFYSETVTAGHCNGKMFSFISPNPVQGNSVRLVLGGWPAQTIRCNIYNSIGQRILEREVKLNGSSSVVELVPVQKISSGTYRLVVEQASGKRTVLPFTVLE
jgi:hypothetical protein